MPRRAESESATRKSPVVVNVFLSVNTPAEFIAADMEDDDRKKAAAEKAEEEEAPEKNGDATEEQKKQPSSSSSSSSESDKESGNDEKASEPKEKRRRRKKKTKRKRKESGEESDSSSSDDDEKEESKKKEDVMRGVMDVREKENNRDAANKEMLTSRTGGAYIPPAKLRMMQKEMADKTGAEFQRLSWEALKKSLNGLINKVCSFTERLARILNRGRGEVHRLSYCWFIQCKPN